MNEYIGDRDELMNGLREIQKARTANDFLDHDIRALEHDLIITTELIKACISTDATNSISEEQFNAH